MDQKIQFLWFSLRLTDLHYYNLSVWEYIYNLFKIIDVLNFNFSKDNSIFQ